MRGTASPALAIAVGWMVAGWRREHWLVYGRQGLSISRPKAGAGQQGQLGKERTT